MAQNLEKIWYRQGMLKAGMNAESLPARSWQGAEIPRDVLEAVDAEGLLYLGGVYGDKKAGSPLQYDNLKLVIDGAVVEITVFNRGLALLMSDDEKIKRIHRVLCKLRGL